MTFATYPRVVGLVTGSVPVETLHKPFKLCNGIYLRLFSKVTSTVTGPIVLNETIGLNMRRQVRGLSLSTYKVKCE